MAKASPSRLLLDTDIVINWLSKEEIKGQALWEAPYEIIKLSEIGKIDSSISLLSLLEVRFVLRRKKNYREALIEGHIEEILSILKVLIPDEVTLLRANKLQSQHPLDPFDSILLALATTMDSVIIVSRDASFLRIARKFIDAKTPEDIVELI